MLFTGAPFDDVLVHFSSLLSRMDARDLSVELDVANKMYYGQNLPLRVSYIKGIQKYFSGKIESLDFKVNENAANVMLN